MIAYKLLRVLKNGDVTSLFINKKERLNLNVWLTAKEYKTKGYKVRKGWHCLKQPIAPHLSMKNRAWYIVEVDNYQIFKRPENQGGEWVLGEKIKIIKKL